MAIGKDVKNALGLRLFEFGKVVMTSLSIGEFEEHEHWRIEEFVQEPERMSSALKVIFRGPSYIWPHQSLRPDDARRLVIGLRADALFHISDLRFRAFSLCDESMTILSYAIQDGGLRNLITFQMNGGEHGNRDGNENVITCAGLEAFCRGLHAIPHLEVLDLGNNHIKHTGFLAFCAAVHALPFSSQLKCLYFDENWMLANTLSRLGVFLLSLGSSMSQFLCNLQVLALDENAKEPPLQRAPYQGARTSVEIRKALDTGALPLLRKLYATRPVLRYHGLLGYDKNSEVQIQFHDVAPLEICSDYRHSYLDLCVTGEQLPCPERQFVFYSRRLSDSVMDAASDGSH